MANYEDDIQELRTYEYHSNGNAWEFLPNELELLRDNNMDHLRFSWGYGEATGERVIRNYETLTHILHSSGGRLLQEYTDVLFRLTLSFTPAAPGVPQLPPAVPGSVPSLGQAGPAIRKSS